MNITQALPRRMKFEAKAASSVELCVAEWASGSRYRDTTVVLAERSDAPLLADLAVERLPPAKRLSSWRLGLYLRGHIRRRQTDVIVTQQHIATAERIARFNPRIPVVLQTHNFIASPVPGPRGTRHNAGVAHALNRLAGITLISDATLAQFEREWPQVTVPRAVVTNGFDFSSWTRDRPKQQRIVVIGRANDNKGILECAQGVRAALARHPDWRATFILSELDPFPDYVAKVRQTVAEAGENAEILTNISYAEVKRIVETSAIGIVASKWAEPFGRTALEVHAAGGALISSGTGGLRQISGDTALYLPAVSGQAVAEALETLIVDTDLRSRLGVEGAARVRRLFSLAASPESNGDTVSGRLDRFLEQIVAGRSVR